MAIKTVPWYPLTGLEVQERHGALLETVVEDSDTELVVEAVRSIACARGMSEVARLAGISEKEMFEAFRTGGEPAPDTLEKVVAALKCGLAKRRQAAEQSGYRTGNAHG